MNSNCEKEDVSVWEGRKGRSYLRCRNFSSLFSFFAGAVNLKYHEYEKHEFLRQTEKGVGVNCGVHKLCVFFLSSSKGSHICKGFTIIRGAV